MSDRLTQTHWLPGDSKPILPPPSERMDMTQAYSELAALAASMPN